MENRILIVTALKVEIQAVQELLGPTKSITHPETGTIYEFSKLDSFDVYAVECGPGNVRAADETSRAITFLKPHFVFFVGVAGGLKDVSVGDVVVSSKVIGYEGAKVTEQVLPRLDVMSVSYRLEQLAKAISRSRDLSPTTVVGFNSYVGPIAAGEKVVASTKTQLYEYLRMFCSDALTIEMEGHGFFQAVRANGIDGIVIRGVSDLIDNKEESDAEGNQDLAAQNAAQFAFMLIRMIAVTHSVGKLSDPAYRSKLVDVLGTLYDKGPETENIWKRAGGDISFLSNASSRKSQWFDAIDRLSKGGGGSITLESLLEIVRQDFPDNQNGL